MHCGANDAILKEVPRWQLDGDILFQHEVIGEQVLVAAHHDDFAVRHGRIGRHGESVAYSLGTSDSKSTVSCFFVLPQIFFEKKEAHIFLYFFRRETRFMAEYARIRRKTSTE